MSWLAHGKHGEELIFDYEPYRVCVHISSDEKVENGNRVTIKLIQNHKQSGVYTHVIFLTNKQYNINDTIYFKK